MPVIKGITDILTTNILYELPIEKKYIYILKTSY